MRDFLGDSLVRIKNGQNAGLPYVLLHPYLPNWHIKVLQLLVDEGFLGRVCVQWDRKSKKLVVRVDLKYDGVGVPIIKDIYRGSNSGRRSYTSTKALWQFQNPSFLVLSTPKGLMSDLQAKLQNVGGEVLLGLKY